MTEDEDRLTQALTEIYQWCQAYPTTSFAALSPEKLKQAADVLKAYQIEIAALHAQWARHLLGEISHIAGLALENVSRETGPDPGEVQDQD